jgi:PAS domain S-box-containing protein
MIWVLGASVASQCLAAGLAFRLIGLTGRRTAWALLASAMALMAVRRVLPLFRLMTGDPSYRADPLAETLGLLLSILMAAGLGFVAPIFAERARMESDLQRSNALLRALLESVPTPIFGLDLEGHVQHIWNPAAERLLGWSAQEVLGRPLPTLPPGGEAEFRELQRRIHAGQTLDGVDVRRQRRDGSPIEYSIHASPLRDAQGRITGNVSVLVDLTDRRRGERERQARLRLAESMDQVHRAIQGTNDLERAMNDVLEAALSIFECDRAFLLYPCDPDAPTWRVPFERTRPEYPGAHAQGLEVETQPEAARAFAEQLASEEPIRFASGSDHPLPEETARRFGFRSFLAVAVRPRQGKAWQFGLHQCSHQRTWTDEDCRLLQEIARRLEDSMTSLLAHRDLKDSERQLRSLLASFPDMVARFDPAGRHLWVNPAVTRAFAEPQEHFLGKTPVELAPPANLATSRRLLAELLSVVATGEPSQTEAEWELPEGRRQFEVRHFPEKDEAGQVVSVLRIGRDVTLRKQTERSLALLSFALDNVRESAFLIDPGARFLYVNEEACRSLGYSRAELLRRGVPDVDPDFPAARWDEHWREIQVRRSLLFEGRHRARDGRLIPVEISANYLEYGDQAYNLALVRDIGERKRAEAELHQHREHLEELVAERTAGLEAANRELESFSYSVSHDLRTPLRAIDGFSRMLAVKYAAALDGEAQRLIGVVRDNAARMSQLIDDILAFSRSGRIGMRAAEVDMDRLVEEAWLDLAPARAGREIRFEHRPLAPARGDPALLRQVWANLLANAVKFTRPVAQPRIEVAGSASASGYTYQVADNGVGFDPAYAHKLFGVFQRLHGMEEFEGTGIGLAIVQRVVARHGGRVEAEGQLGRGATFRFTLGQRGESP